MNHSPTDPSDASLRAIAEALVHARRHARPLAEFPGEIPPDLLRAYHVQDYAIARWQDRLVGWKVGFIAPERRDGSGDERLLGPIFQRGLQRSSSAERAIDIPVFEGGFAAVEAEYVLRLEADAPPEQTQWTPAQALAHPASLWIGVEVASSPLASINQLGPCVVVSDFGNNNGLVLGARIPDWQTLDETGLIAETFIEDRQVGRGGAPHLPGGLRQAFAFALARSAQRGRPLRRGDLIATGNATGIHDIRVGETARIAFGDHGRILCRAVSA
ncbi:2-keto-4-pentenoate hydratase [Lysobacter sp. CA199]|uniref:2-keto-4-pentenoate hydratase n=1 Tax=Lysobacter sp. CA199 TaxID=3455608 RepID=UPI003F8D18B0